MSNTRGGLSNIDLQAGRGGELILLGHVLAGHDDDVLAGRDGDHRGVLPVILDRGRDHDGFGLVEADEEDFAGRAAADP